LWSAGAVLKGMRSETVYRQITLAVIWFLKVDLPDDGGGDRHRNMLECSLIL
jgi:hypothetical protein